MIRWGDAGPLQLLTAVHRKCLLVSTAFPAPLPIARDFKGQGGYQLTRSRGEEAFTVCWVMDIPLSSKSHCVLGRGYLEQKARIRGREAKDTVHGYSKVKAQECLENW